MRPLDEALALFPIYTRESYLAQFGVQAPPPDPGKPMKNWKSDGATGSFTRVIGPGSKPPRETFQDAAPESVNLPGEFRFPRYHPNTVGATTFWVGAINPTRLSYRAADHCTLAEAEALADEIGRDTGTRPPVMELSVADLLRGIDTPVRVEFADADHRVYYIGGGIATAPSGARLLDQRNAFGIGHPGKWISSGPGDYSWVSAQIPVATGPGSVPMPHRALSPGEQVVDTMFGLMVDNSNAASPALAGCDPVNFAEIGTLVRQILAVLQIQEARR